MPPIPHPLDMPKKRLKQTIHSLCSPLNVPQQQNNSLGLPLSSTNKQRSLSNPLNVELCSTTAKELAQFTFQLYHYNLKLAFTIQPLHTQLYTQKSSNLRSKLLLAPPTSANLGKKRKKSKEIRSANTVKWWQSA